MDLTLPMQNGLFNMRVTILLKQNDKYILEYRPEDQYYFSVGGRVKFGETIFEAAQRELKEETGLENIKLQFLTILQNLYTSHFKEYKATHELNFIFCAKVPENALLEIREPFVLLNEAEIMKYTVYPILLKEIVQTKDLSVAPLIEHIQLKDTDSTEDLCLQLPLKWQAVYTCEVNIRVSAIIRTSNGILVDISTLDQQHPVIIGGRMKAFETIEESLFREVTEELTIQPKEVIFRGIGEDFFCFRNLRAHFVSLYFEVTIDEAELQPTDEIVFDCWQEQCFEQTVMKLASTKAFVQDKQVKHCISYDTCITDIMK